MFSKTNKDPGYVVMTRRDFDLLVAQAQIGDNEVRAGTTDKVLTNVERLNTAFAKEREADREAQRASLEKNRQLVHDFVNKHKGQQVWLHQCDPYYEPVVVQGVMDDAEHGCFVSVLHHPTTRRTHGYVGSCHISNLRAELSPRARKAVDKYWAESYGAWVSPP